MDEVKEKAEWKAGKWAGFKCPFCMQPVEAGEEVNGEAAVLHGVPMCERYERMDPLDYLTLARQTMQMIGAVADGTLADAHEEHEES